MEEQKSTEPILFAKGANREAILILHGFAIDISNTDLLFKYFCEKGYTVARPILPGHSGTKDDLKSHGPEEWLEYVREWLIKLEADYDRIFILGISFGSNLAVSLATDERHKKIAGVVVSEMPIFFNFRIWLIVRWLQPLFQMLGIDFISKEGPFYRKNHMKRQGVFNFIPVRIVGEIRRFIANRTKKEISRIKVPVFILQAEKSDLLNNKRIQKYICDRIPFDHRTIYCLPIDNHDLNILDEEGKILMLQHIHQFVKANS